ncbi:MAG: hypothetical protein M1294_15385 [Firmicutes bacterium]|nr:hypothetical protein [Bacillota bacterium]MCL5013768.1 hypothetical protein [Bacillota bacterium]
MSRQLSIGWLGLGAVFVGLAAGFHYAGALALLTLSGLLNALRVRAVVMWFSHVQVGMRGRMLASQRPFYCWEPG